ncbi:MAG: hypothetical protein ACI4SR_09585 [Faecalibacillus sp.]
MTIRITGIVNSAKWYGKVSTAVLYIVMMVLIFYVDIPEKVANLLIVLCSIVMLMSLILYGRFYINIFKNTVHDEKQNDTNNDL